MFKIKGMDSLVGALIVFCVLGIAIYLGRYKPSPEQIEFDAKFDSEATLVKTCGPDLGVASATPQRVFRYHDKLWFRERGQRWREIDATVDNVCDLLGIAKGHEPKETSFVPPFKIK